MGHPYWPMFDLEVSTPRLAMVPIDDEMGVALAALAARGIHPPDFMPFKHPWSRAESPALERHALQFYWRCRAEMTPERWNINFAIVVDGEVVGSSGLMGNHFPRLRQFESGSWLGRDFQGRGIGKEMRLATLTLGFVGFGAEWATTGAWHDNAASIGVTRSLGYSAAGHRRAIRDDEHGDTLVGFEMPRSHFDEHLRRHDIELVGIDAARDFLAIPT